LAVTEFFLIRRDRQEYLRCHLPDCRRVASDDAAVLPCNRSVANGEEVWQARRTLLY